jgi:hypothetical protein
VAGRPGSAAHRHNRARPAGYETATAIVLDPGAFDRYLTGNLKTPQPGLPGQGWAWVYPVLPVVATLEAIARDPLLVLPDRSRTLVESATHPDALEVLGERGERWQVALNALENIHAGMVAKAEVAWVRFDEFYGPEYPASNEVTRLAIDTVTIETPGLASLMHSWGRRTFGNSQRLRPVVDLSSRSSFSAAIDSGTE